MRVIKTNTSFGPYNKLFIFLKLGFTPFKAEQPLQSMESQEKEAQED